MSETLPDDPFLLKHLLAQMVSVRQLDQGKIIQLQKQNALLLQRLFDRKSKQNAYPDSPQLEFFNEAENLTDTAPETVADDVEEEIVAPVKRRGKRKPLPDHELTCVCGCARKCSHRRHNAQNGTPQHQLAVEFVEQDVRQ